MKAMYIQLMHLFTTHKTLYCAKPSVQYLHKVVAVTSICTHNSGALPQQVKAMLSEALCLINCSTRKYCSHSLFIITL